MKKKTVVLVSVRITADALFYDFYGFRSAIQVLNPLGLYLWAWRKRAAHFGSFACNCPGFPTPLVAETLSRCVVSASPVNNPRTIRSVFLGLPSRSLTRAPASAPAPTARVPTAPWHILLLRIVIRSVVVSSEIALAIRGVSCFHTSFKMILRVWKMLLAFWEGLR